MTALERLGVLQLYPPKTKSEKKDGWKYVPMKMIFDVNQQDLHHKARLLVGGNVMDYKEHTIYLSSIKYLSVRLVLLLVA